MDRKQLTKRIERLEAKSLNRKWSGPVVIIHWPDGTVSPDMRAPHLAQIVINVRFAEPKTI